ncbi:hypothetical protein COM89_26885 [Bacillus thuringiensis]|uniref:competence protein CoiA family protein n=1 Tax=Bacillus thuringiensis TaxID=1428 RepID=UPI000BED385F|nr:hypothetical protein [Bacillus thuringiensis]PEB72608.1 hypothetical protein COM89_26885 [Bacillus thuringiensis]
MQYSYIEFFNCWEDKFPSGKKITLKERDYIELNSMTLEKNSEVKLIQGKKALYKTKCPICHEVLSYNQGSTNRRNPFFFHLSRRKCFEHESLAHGQTKGYLYDLFKKAGYHVKEEKRHKDLTRADVAVLQIENGREELKLAIEVQASNIQIGNIARRINAYFEERVPTAWVLVLDSFFPPKKSERDGEIFYTDSYSGTRKSTFNTETLTYEYTYISTKEEALFHVTGSDNKAFNYLMDLYHVIVAVDHNGHVFLIRRTEESTKLRLESMLENRPHSTQDDIFLINRVAESHIVPVLLETELLYALTDEVASTKNMLELYSDDKEFKGKLHKADFESEKMVDSSINFDKAHQIIDGLNSLELARQAREQLLRLYHEQILELERKKQEELAEQMAKDLIEELFREYDAALGILTNQLNQEKGTLYLHTIEQWYDWLKHVSKEHESWDSYKKKLFKGFSTKFIDDLNELELYFINEKDLFINWLKLQDLHEVVKELKDHYNRLNMLEFTDSVEIKFYKNLLHKLETKLDKKIKLEETLKKEHELRVREEMKRQEKLKILEEKKLIETEMQKHEEMRILAEKLKEEREILLLEPNDTSDYPKEEIKHIKDNFWNNYIRMSKKERINCEKEFFPKGPPPWFTSKKLPHEEKELIEEKKHSNNKVPPKKTKDNDDGFIQLTLI